MTKPWWTRALLGRTAVSNPLEPLGPDDGPDPQFEAQWRPLIKKRLFAIFACLALWVVTLEGRLIWVQVVDHEYWAGKAKVQQEDSETIEPVRGTIKDRNGRLVAYSVSSVELHVNPAKIKNIETASVGHDFREFARHLCVALDDCEPGELAAIVAKLEKPKAQDVVVRRARQMSLDA